MSNETVVRGLGSRGRGSEFSLADRERNGSARAMQSN